jgi:branched-chain amino acid transport system substrate-binding protein
MSGWRSLASGALVAVGLLAAGCSASSGPAADQPATGRPIKVGQIADLSGGALAQPEAGARMVASIKALNASGGVAGHPLVLDQCDTAGEAAAEVSYADKMVGDHVVADLGDATFADPSQTQAVLTAAGISRIGTTEVSPSEYQATNNLAFTGGGVFTLVGIVQDLVSRGDTKISLLIPASPDPTQTEALLCPIASSLGATLSYVLVPATPASYGQLVAQAELGGAQGIGLALGSAQLVEVARAIEDQGSSVDVATGVAGLSTGQLAGLPSFAKRASFVWWTPGIDDVRNFPGLSAPLAALTH